MKDPIAAAVFVAVFIAMSILVYVGKVPPASLGALLAWLIPSPISRGSP